MARRKRKSTGSAGRFGARYGRKARRLVAEIEDARMVKHQCPSCKYHAVRRVDSSIWGCKKCGYTFTGGAHIPSTSTGSIALRSIKKSMR